MGRKKREMEDTSKKEDRQEGRTDRKSDKHDYKISKVNAKTEKAYATAAKRQALASLLKWIVILIGVIYGITKMGGLGAGGSLLETAKGWFQ